MAEIALYEITPVFSYLTRNTFISTSALNHLFIKYELEILCTYEIFQISKLLLKFTFFTSVTQCLIDYALGITLTSSDFHRILKNRMGH